jgi:hypothetical protein
MAFQSSVFLAQGFGVPGELYTDGPHRAESFILESASAAYNIIGATAFTVTNEGIAAAGGTGVFAGILVNPKVYATSGTVSGALAPTLTLPNETQAELLTMGSIVVTLPAAAAIGDSVIYDNTTGALSTIAPGADLPSGKTFANAVVDYYTVSAAGLAVITLSPALVIPQPA